MERNISRASGVRRNWDDRTCTHQWSQWEWEENDCLKNGRAVYVCGRCQKEKIEHLPALGHLDENGDQICDRCGSVDWSESEMPGKVIWKGRRCPAAQGGGRFCHLPVSTTITMTGRMGIGKQRCSRDRVIRADVDTGAGKKMKISSFGKDNNYTAGGAWLAEKQSE